MIFCYKKQLEHQHTAQKCQQISLTPLITWSLFLVVLAVIFSSCSTFPVQTKQDSSISCSSRSSKSVTLTMAYSSEKRAWVEDVVKDFNNRHMTACDGPITVQATPTGSGQSMQHILDGSLQPDIWSPAGNVWITLLNAQWHNKYGNQLVGTGAKDTPSLVVSPIVIAMWQPQAKALGWPQTPIGWADIAKLSTDPQGWKTYGHPEFGQFKFGHTHPELSNSGLNAVIAMNYAATNKLRGLTVSDVNNNSTKDFVANVESSVIHYGESTGFFADKMFGQGPSYLSATVMYENLVIEANDGKKYPHLPYPVVAIYPKEGTFNSDHPFATLQGKWVSPAKKAAASTFRNFLLAPAQQAKAVHYGFRPADPNTKLAAPIDSKHGVDSQKPSTVLPLPNADVVGAIQTSWKAQRRRVDVLLILDRSGSMKDAIGDITKIDGAKTGLKEFINLMSDQDRLGLTTFSGSADVLTEVSPLGPKRQDILSRVDGIIADGETLLFDTIAQQFQTLEQLPSKHIKAMVVLTDGQDTKSSLSLDQLIKRVTPSGEDAGEAIKIFTIAYGGEANKDELTQIANKTGGQQYSGTPQNIREVYEQISEFF